MIDKMIRQTVYNQQRKKEIKQQRSIIEINSEYINYTTKQSKSTKQSSGYLTARPLQQKSKNQNKNSATSIVIAIVIGGLIVLSLL